MSAYVTATGLSVRTYQEILDGLKARVLADVDPALDLSENSPDGQILAICAAELRDAWEALGDLHSAYDADGAESAALENICALTGTVREPATYSTVTVAVTHGAGYSAPAGSIIAHVQGYPDRVFTNENLAGPLGAGTDNVLFTCSTPGPVAAPAGLLTEIDSAPAGTTSITNALAAALGADEETDANLSLRRVVELNSLGSCNPSAVGAALQNTDNDATLALVLSVKVYENTTDVTDADGLLPHSIECMIDDSGGSVSDTVLAQTIWENKGTGLRTVGTVSATATDSEGGTHTINFSRPTYKSVYVSVTVEGDPDTDEIKSAILEEIEAYKPGDDVQALMIVGKVSRVSGVTGIQTFGLGFSASPVGTSNLTIARDERATSDETKLVITVA